MSVLVDEIDGLLCCRERQGTRLERVASPEDARFSRESHVDDWSETTLVHAPGPRTPCPSSVTSSPSTVVISNDRPEYPPSLALARPRKVFDVAVIDDDPKTIFVFEPESSPIRCLVDECLQPRIVSNVLAPIYQSRSFGSFWSDAPEEIFIQSTVSGVSPSFIHSQNDWIDFLYMFLVASAKSRS